MYDDFDDFSDFSDDDLYSFYTRHCDFDDDVY